VNEFDASSTEIRQAFVENNLESVNEKLNEKVFEALQETNEKLKKI
jgi:predicted nucleotidyltransferase